MAATWKRNAGKILCAGDSITNGADGYTGGWRKKLFADLATAGIACSGVGPYTTNSPGMTQTAHRGLNGDKASAAKTGIGAQAATYLPSVVVYGWGMNDLGTGTSNSATYLNDIDACIDAVQANVPFALHFVQTLVYPTPGDEGNYYPNIAQYQSAQSGLQARVAAQGAILVDVGQPVLTDGVHPADGSTGYDAMATAIYNAILAAIP